MSNEINEPSAFYQILTTAQEKLARFEGMTSEDRFLQHLQRTIEILQHAVTSHNTGKHLDTVEALTSAATSLEAAIDLHPEALAKMLEGRNHD